MTVGSDFRLFAGRANPSLAAEVAERLGVELGKMTTSTFVEHEVHVQLDESVRGTDIFLIQPTCQPVNDSLMELLVAIDTMRRASARSITAVVPYFGYGRQDHKSTGREPISAKLVANLLTTAGADRLISVDLHAAQIQGFFDIPADHLTAVTTLADYVRSRDFEDPVVVSPDVGRAKVAERYADLLGVPLVMMHKRRSGIGGREVKVVEIVGDVRGRTPIIIDDMMASGSVYQQADALVNAGSEPAVLAVTHPVLVGPALERLDRPTIREVVVTNTVPVPDEKRLGGKITVLSIAPLLADAIYRIHTNQSVSAEFSDGGFEFPV